MGDKKFLEGKELEGKIGEVGSYYVDVTKEGSVTIGASISVAAVDGDVKLKNEFSAEAHILDILSKIAAKNDKAWDESAIAGIRSILGLIG